MTKAAVAAAALTLFWPLIARGGPVGVAVLFVVFFLLRGFWLDFLKARSTSYAVSSSNIAIRRTGLAGGWWKYSVDGHFLQDDFGIIRVFSINGPHSPVARLRHLSAQQRAAALRATGAPPRRRFLVRSKLARQDWPEMLPSLAAYARIETMESDKVVWHGHPQSSALRMPLILPAAAAIALFAAALVLAIRQDWESAAWSGAGAAVAALIEIRGYSGMVRRFLKRRFAIAGHYAIELSPALIPSHYTCEIHRIGPRSLLSDQVTQVVYGVAASWISRTGWVVGFRAFHDPSDKANLLIQLSELISSRSPPLLARTGAELAESRRSQELDCAENIEQQIVT